MTDVVITTGRRMTGLLQAALDDLTGSSRQIVAQVLTEQADRGGTVSKLFRALVIELQLCQLREDDLLRRMAQDHQASLPEPPAPPAASRSWTPDDDAA